MASRDEGRAHDHRDRDGAMGLHVCVCICVCADEKMMDWMGEERDKRESAIVKAASYHIITAAISLTALMAKQ